MVLTMDDGRLHGMVLTMDDGRLHGMVLTMDWLIDHASLHQWLSLSQ